tara:strand:- start:537 stop:689 length:153 start_codon:yes stop_codon:yes gene_type:complete
MSKDKKLNVALKLVQSLVRDDKKYNCIWGDLYTDLQKLELLIQGEIDVKR